MSRTKSNGRKKVLVVGAGAAGMSAAHHLAQHPDRFDVTLIDSVNYCGGQAFSAPLDKNQHGASWLNQGVQGGSHIFHHTMTMFARQGYHADPVRLQVSFGKDETFWTNVFPTELLAKHQSEIRRFVTVLKIARWFEIIFALMPLKLMLKLFFFSEDFINLIALPMTALFLGTGNATPETPSIMLERLCTSPTYGMWYPADKHSVASNLPPMVVFPNFSDFYETWRKDLVKRGVQVRLSTEMTQVVKRDKDGVVVSLIKRNPTPDNHNPVSGDTHITDNHDPAKADSDGQEWEEEYDELILCVLADTAKRLLSHSSTRRERRVLGSAKFSDDITITHTDSAYMKRHYENFYNAKYAVGSLSGVDQSRRNGYGSESFKPMYYIKEYEGDRSKLEMCFDCSNYQAQFPERVPFEKHVFQTIFLNRARDSHLWSDAEIDDTKVIRRDWWHQLCHSYTHYLFVVPWIWLLQGRRHTRYAAAWTLVNAHEVAVISGIAAAVNLGADYPQDLERDRFALLTFRLYYLLIYGRWYRKQAKDRDGDGKQWATGLYGSWYAGPGRAQEEKTIWREEVERGRSTENWD